MYWLIPVLSIAGSILLIKRRLQRLRRVLYEITGEFDSVVYDGSLWKVPWLEGQIQGCLVEVNWGTADSYSGWVVRVLGELDIEGEFGISRETGVTRMARALGIKDVETGDATFDRAMLLSTVVPRQFTGLLDKVTRSLILELPGCTSHFEIKGSLAPLSLQSYIFQRPHVIVLAVLPKRETHSPLKLWKLIQLGVRICANLTRDVPVKGRLLHNIKTDPVPRVCINNIRALTSGFSLDKKDIAVLRELLSHPDMGVQVEAARHLGPEGKAHLAGLLESRNALLKDEDLLFIIDMLGRSRYRECVPVLPKVYLAARNNMVKEAVLKAFTLMGHQEAGPFLLSELGKKDPDLELPIMKALGVCGGVEAVEMLYELGKASMSPGVRRAAKEAIAKIQARLGDVEKGWLSPVQLQELDGALSTPGND